MANVAKARMSMDERGETEATRALQRQLKASGYDFSQPGPPECSPPEGCTPEEEEAWLRQQVQIGLDDTEYLTQEEMQAEAASWYAETERERAAEAKAKEQAPVKLADGRGKAGLVRETHLEKHGNG